MKTRPTLAILTCILTMSIPASQVLGQVSLKVNLKDGALDKVLPLEDKQELACTSTLLFGIGANKPGPEDLPWEEVADEEELAKLDEAIKTAAGDAKVFRAKLPAEKCGTELELTSEDEAAKFFAGPEAAPEAPADGDQQPEGTKPPATDHVTASAGVLAAVKALTQYVKDSLKNDVADGVYLSIGGQFDFLEKTSVNGLYFDVNYYTPQISTKKCLRRISIDAKVAQGQFSRGLFFEDSDSNLVASFNFRDAAVSETDSRFLAERYRLKRDFELKYGLMRLDVRWDVLDNYLYKDEMGNKRDKYRANVTVSLPYAEYFVYYLKTTTSPNLLTRDTIIAPTDTAIVTVPYRLFEDGVATSQTRRTHAMNVGTGLSFRYRSENTLVTIGGYTGFSAVRGVKNTWFYMANFEYTALKYGIKFGGELRYNFLGSVVPFSGITQLRDPVAHIYIAKTFGGAALMRFITDGAK